MCYFLYMASPLTLSEVRSMLPPGLTVELAPSADQQSLKEVYPEAQTVARILVGRCSCDLVRARLPQVREDERHLRERYRKLGVSRELAVKALERHRRAGPREPKEGWPTTLSRFIAEHARNAGPTLYHLFFSPVDGPLPRLGELHHVGLDRVTKSPAGWLPEASPVLISR